MLGRNWHQWTSWNREASEWVCAWEFQGPSQRALECLIQIQSIYCSWKIKAPSGFQHNLSGKRSRADFEKEGDRREARGEGRSSPVITQVV